MLETADDPRTIAWVEAENALTRSGLDTPRRERFVARLKQLHRYPRRSLPIVRNGRAFFTENDGTREQAVLLARDWGSGLPEREPRGRERVVVDPNVLDSSGTTAITACAPDDEGRNVVYGLSRGGSDIQELIVFDCGRAIELPDRINWVKFASIAWAGDASGFFYTRYPEPGTVAPGNEQYFCQVRFHRLGDPQSADALVYDRPDAPEVVFDINITSDGRYLVITSRRGASDNAEVHVVRDPARLTSRAYPLVTGFESGWHFVDGRGDRLLFLTDAGAPLGRIVAFDVAPRRSTQNQRNAQNSEEEESSPCPMREIVPESDEKLDYVAVAGGRLVIASLRNASSRVHVCGLDGSNPLPAGIPEFGTVSGISARWDDPDFFVAFTSCATPPTVLSGRSDRPDAVDLRPAFEGATPIDPSEYVTEQVWYPSKDGLRVSMFLVSKRRAAGPASGAALLTGYGGFNISLTPQFDPADFLWLDAGGVIAIANLRGGGEYGEAWHQAGMRERKQNVFDDFIAAAEWLLATERAASGRIAIEGGSNGGLLVGAVMVQRPDLFGAVVCRVPVADMLRYHLFTVGRFWIPEYGSADDSDDFAYLFQYSPYHNVRDGIAYPPTLVMTADTDDRVDPGMAKKFAARLQEASTGGDVLLRVEMRAGHGVGKPIAKQVDEQADMCEFLFQHLTEATRNEQ